MTGPYDGVDFPDEYPQQHVAEHEVFMSFNDDDDAIGFREWWHAEGSEHFNKWLEENQAP